MSAFQVKIVGDFCNLRCKYCFNCNGKRSTKTIMHLDVLEKVFKVLSQSKQETIRVHWHGGESLLAGIDFFERIIAHEKKISDKRFVNIIQTNATLVTKDWADFLFQNHFHIGVSIDGDEAMHNLNRVYENGQGSYKDTLRGANILRSVGFKVGVICTVTKETIASGKKGFLSLVKNDFNSVAFNAFHEESDLFEVRNVSNNEWLDFLKDIFDTWIELNDDKIRVREIDRILAWVEGRVANTCAFKSTCANWFTIDWDGLIYPCERIGRVPKFGDINKLDSFDEIFQTEEFANWSHKLHILPDKCKKCSMVELCNNGCTSHRIKKDEIPHFVYCDAQLSFFDYIKDQIGVYSKKKEVICNG